MPASVDTGTSGGAAPAAGEATPAGDPAQEGAPSQPVDPSTVADPGADPVARSREAVTAMEVKAVVPALERQTLTVDLRPPTDGSAAVRVVGEVPEGAQEALGAGGPGAAGAELAAGSAGSSLVDLPVKSRTLPVYPPALEIVYGEQAIRCAAWAELDEKGRPTRAAVDCPAGFHLAALSALRGWQWQVPPDGLGAEPAVVTAEIGFVRSQKPYRPGVSVLARPEQVTGDLGSRPLLRSGAMPTYPRNVAYGDFTCVVELTVTEKGRGAWVLVDECPPLYRAKAEAAVKSWSWYPAIRDGQPVSQQVEVDLRFLLEQTPARSLGD